MVRCLGNGNAHVGQRSAAAAGRDLPPAPELPAPPALAAARLNAAAACLADTEGANASPWASFLARAADADPPSAAAKASPAAPTRSSCSPSDSDS